MVLSIPWTWLSQETLSIDYKRYGSRQSIEDRIFHHRPFLLNSGLPAVFQGNQTVINLNRPKLISQIIRYCLDHEDEIPWDEHKPLNGVNILKKMGFEIPPIFLD